MLNKNINEKLTFYIAASCYLVIGFLWLFFSDNFFATMLSRPEMSYNTLALSHWIFIAITAIFIYWGFHSWDRIARLQLRKLNEVHMSKNCVDEWLEAITTSTDEHELLTETCRILVEVGGYACAWVDFSNQKQSVKSAPIARLDDNSNFIESIHARWAEAKAGCDPLAMIDQTGKTQAFQSFKMNRDCFPWKNEALGYGYDSGIFLPLHGVRNPSATLVIFSRESKVFPDADVHSLEDLADKLACRTRFLRSTVDKNC